MTTVQDKLVAHLQQSGLAALIDDQDAIQEIARLAIAKAVTEPLIVFDSWRNETRPSRAVAAADEVAKAACEQVVESEIANLVSDDSFRKLVREAIAAQMPIALAGGLKKMLHDIAVEDYQRLVTEIQNVIKMERMKNPS